MLNLNEIMFFLFVSTLHIIVVVLAQKEFSELIILSVILLIIGRANAAWGDELLFRAGWEAWFS